MYSKYDPLAWKKATATMNPGPQGTPEGRLNLLISAVALSMVGKMSITATDAGKLLNCNVMSGTSHPPGFKEFQCYYDLLVF